MPGIQQLKAQQHRARWSSAPVSSPDGFAPDGRAPDGVAPDWPELVDDDAARRRRLLRQTIEQHVVPHLLRLHPAKQDVATAFTHEEIAALARHAMQGRPDQVFASLAALVDAGVTPEALCLDVLAPAARHLGDLWHQDECHFVDVTIGVARLHQALRRLAPPADAGAGPRQRAPSILMVPVPGEQHHFGLAMAADLFRRAGWSVSSGMSPGLEALRVLVRARHFDVVGVSASCDRHAETLARTLRQVRQCSRNARVVTMVGGPLFVSQPELAVQLGADAVATDGSGAPALAASMLPDWGDRNRSAAGDIGPTARTPVSGELKQSGRRAASPAHGDRVRQSRSGGHQEDRAGRR